MSATAGLIVIGIWTIIQAIGFGSMAFMGLLAHTCQMSMNGTRLSHFIYAVYFRDHECKPVNWTFLIGHNVSIEPEMPDVTHVASRTNIFAMVYFIISIIWLVTSLMLLIGTCISCMGKCGYYLMFHPWIYVTIANIALDIVASGYLIWDLINSMSWLSFLQHLEVKNANLFPPIDDEYLLPIPSIIMLCVAARLLIFWILNIALIPVVFSLGRKAVFGESGKTQRNSVQLDARPPFERSNPNHNNQIGYMIGAGVVGNNEGHLANEGVHGSQNIFTNSDTNRYSDPVANQHTNIPQYNRPPQVAHAITARRHFEPLKGRESPGRSDDGSLTGKLSNDVSDSMENTKNLKLENRYSSQDKQNKISPSIEKMSYLGEYEEKRLSIERPHLTSRTSKLPNAQNDFQNEPKKTRVDPRLSHNPPAELRGQLPWSYFKSRDDVSGPKKTFTQLREDEDAPPVPVPDYTLHFPRKDRKRTSSVTTDDGKWNGPETRY